MYTVIKNVQILIALLKAHDIRHLVICPGARMKDFAFSVEQDDFFVCYSVVDERSAAYFAIGLSQELHRPVGVVCTSSTATCNFLPAITESYYQGVPLLVITGDQNPYFLGQMQDQMINQVNIYHGVVKKAVTLPLVDNDEDFWYCERLINEALLELDHRGQGPVHINVPVCEHSLPLTVKSLPKVRKIDRIKIPDAHERFHEKLQILRRKTKILLIAGQNALERNESLNKNLNLFCEKYNSVIYAEYMANLQIESSINIVPLFSILSFKTFDELLPDLVISFGGSIGVYGLKGLLRSKKVEHWLIHENGEIIDGLKNLTTVFECSSACFFDYLINNTDNATMNNKSYYNIWEEACKNILQPEYPYSNVYIIQQFINKIPHPSILHLSILNSIRVSHFFKISADVKVYANIGTDGIDGSLSSFLGQSVISELPAFLIIGDLSFFYDMGAMRIRHLKNNVRILLINNGGGCEFHVSKSRPKTLDLHIGAGHSTKAKGWIESLGFLYLSAGTKEEFDSLLESFIVCKSEKPIVFEVFTDINIDADAISSFTELNSKYFNKNDILNRLGHKVNEVFGDEIYLKARIAAKKILKR